MKPAIAFCLFAVPLAFGQDLATRLATPDLRPVAVREITNSGSKDLPLLLSWTESPPPGVDQFQLKLGLMEAFRRLRAREAIPFLMKWMDLDIAGLNDGSVWMKAEPVVQTRLPAIDALIAIGPDASKALIAAWDRMTPVLQIEALLIISRIADPSAFDFLNSFHGGGEREARYVQEGLARIEQRR